jgi:hypothetical protein
MMNNPSRRDAAIVATVTADSKHRIRIHRLHAEVARTDAVALSRDPFWVYATGPGLLWLGRDSARSQPYSRPLRWNGDDRLNLALFAANLPLPRRLVAVYLPDSGDLLIADAVRTGAALRALLQVSLADPTPGWWPAWT